MASPFPPSTTPPSRSDAPLPLAPRGVPAGNGASWWGEAWRLFVPSIGVWLLVIVILFVLNLVVGLVPVLGSGATMVLYPVFIGGLMLGCRALDQGQPLTINHLFAGFSERAGPLLVVGLLYAGIAIAITLTVAGVLLIFFGGAVLSQLFRLADPFAASAMLGGTLMVGMVGALIFMLLFLPLLMAVWFAPALVVLRGIEPWTAMKMSFSGCLQNVLPSLVYGMIGIALAVVASIPLGLGWLVLGPVTIASIYTAYCDIFEDGAAS